MNEQSFEYRTGRTEPTKNRQGIIAFLLILVIFLCGIVSALGLMNIRLFRLLEQMGNRDETPLSFSQESDPTAAESAAALQISGMSCVEPGDVYRQLYDLPQGLYISHVEENSPAQLAGIAPGDVLVRMAETDTPDLAGLEALVDTFSGSTVKLTVSRKGTLYQYDLFLTGETK
jgi:C-terminal processing protease CtpA/Prc